MGWLVGLVACVVVALFGIALPTNPYSPLAAGVGCVAVTLALFGARNEEGLATMPRALGLVSPASFQSETLTMVTAMLARVALLAVLAANSPGAALCALFAGHVVSRFSQLLLPRLLDFIGNADREGLVAIGNRALGLAAAWCPVPLLVAAWAKGPAFVLVAVLASGIVTTLLVHLCRTRLQGYTRDAFDAAQPCCEIAFLLGAACALGSA